VLRCVAAVAIGLALFALNSSRAQLATAVLLAHVQPPSVDPPPLESFSSPPPPPPPPPAAVQSAPLGRHLPAPPASLTLTFGTVTLKHFVYNWLRHAARVPRLTYAVVTFDAELEQLCQSWGEPSISGRELLAGRGAEVAAAFGALSRGYVRDQTGAFKQLGFLKVLVASGWPPLIASLLHRMTSDCLPHQALTTARLLELGYDVLLSDADAVWLGDPWSWIGGRGVVLADDAGDLPLADVLATNDMPDLRRDGQV